MPSTIVQVWRIDLARAPGACAAWLAPEERARADRFRFDRDRDRYMAAHAALRGILARAADAPPGGLRFSSGPFGKPFLPEHAGLEFNLSHAGDLALVAVARGLAVGIDVEAVARADERLNSIERFLSPSESADLARLSPGDRPHALLRLWTCKEAWIKGTGEGLSRPLNSFDIELLPDAARLAATRPPLPPGAIWTLHAVDVGPEFLATLAVPSAEAKIETRDWEHHFA
jgi:4'-phosphopantetheinyl transferase